MGVEFGLQERASCPIGRDVTNDEQFHSWLEDHRLAGEETDNPVSGEA